MRDSWDNRHGQKATPVGTGSTASLFASENGDAVERVPTRLLCDHTSRRREIYSPLPAVMLLVCLAPLVLLAAGCHQTSGTVLGKTPKGELRTILAIRAGDTPPQVTVRGVMVEKCPVAGCWLRVKDDTGIIKVDTKTAGFTVVNVPLDTKVTVAGKIVMEGDEPQLDASGLTY